MHNDRMQHHGINCVGEKLNQHSHNQVILFVRRDTLLRGFNTRHKHLRAFGEAFIWDNTQESIGTGGILNRFIETSFRDVVESLAKGEHSGARISVVFRLKCVLLPYTPLSVRHALQVSPIWLSLLV